MNGHAAIIRCLLDSGLDFAIYRFPNEQEPYLVLQLEGEASVVQGTEEPEGFIFAPFAETEITPTLLIRPDVAVRGWELIRQYTCDLPHRRVSLGNIPLVRKETDIDKSNSYKVAYRTFKYQLDKENYQKLVLSYSELSPWSAAGHEEHVFIKALKDYPASMVSLVYTRRSGRWIGCSPELLLEGYGNKWHTMALAGTMEYGQGEWSQKNMREQELVTDYIEGQLQGLGARIMRDGPYTVQSGTLAHLRTDFTFHLQRQVSSYHIARLLHPTPAVCGLPKDEAWRFIRLFERNRRLYYTGFLGPINLRGETNLYVNIRCANIRSGGKALFFAGGGLTHSSDFREERMEVKRKLETLKNIH